MKRKLLIFLRLLRNILIAILSAAYVLPLYLATYCTLDHFSWLEEKAYKEGIILRDTFFSLSGLPFAIAQVLFNCAYAFLAATTMFWSFVIANKLWPIKVKPKDEQKQ